MKRQISDYQSFRVVNLSDIKGGVRCPQYLVSAVRGKDPATLQRIIKRFEAYSPETAAAVSSAATTAGINFAPENTAE
jgi:hypothetical protein